MTLIKSISGFRGTIGGLPENNLTPVDVVKFASAYGTWVKNQNYSKVVVGRDARISGPFIEQIVVSTLSALGIDVVNLGLSTTPTVEMAVPAEKAGGGIIITASHNPKQWNALKLLNYKGEFISQKDGLDILDLAAKDSYSFADVDHLGTITNDDSYIDKHIQTILELPLVDKKAIEAADFKIAIDSVNSTGGIAIPKLLDAIGVKKYHSMYGEPTGHFPHNPEPLAEHLTEICSLVKEGDYDLGIVVDPDVDRLAFVSEDGSLFGEEYTLVAVADYVVKNTPGNTVSNLSSTRALRDVTENYGQHYFASAVGEVNVVEMMKAQNAVIGGEGNGGIIYPELHYGRDALVGIALFLTHLAKKNIKVSALRASYPPYFISKNKIELEESLNVDEVLAQVAEKYASQPVNTIDGVKIEFDKQWVHLRKSNTEPIIRIYAESADIESADKLAHKIMEDIRSIAVIQ